MAAWILGVSGGIGSGKTAATDHFQTLGIDVIDADIVAREIVQIGESALADIAEHFGQNVLQADGTLNRAVLREIVFADPAQRKALEAITHPAIRQRLHEQCMAAQSPYAILASPLLWESGQAALTQRSLLIDASEATQLARASQRDGVSEAQIRAIMAAQWTREQRLAAADDVISNEGSVAELQQQINDIHQTYLAWQP
ncbi:dephospho-CoA kinase [Paraperlucidibaca wandonensis]|jgi:dephospho-CoA kinase|uniref:Dephospho-CoA kinase n=1 Tax=Paraperlucidibaca wandonensis TaxID=1268273 RepID=A0ABW3HH82_9GAMM|nr:dephospho-CoA kinase [Paraperlucidibaca sp.]MBQ0723533.1 dephospho-CoA kinase [Paraperlucidibaca sp.]|tara:strand:- start:123 stop:722 length:600 start_codon:yes stop_codon:yes gene_type:complete